MDGKNGWVRKKKEVRSGINESEIIIINKDTVA